MSSTPWMKFYPRDWRGDQSLRAVSVAARGLWIECLCIMHEAKPYGHLVLNGNPVEDDTLARMTGVPVDEVSALMAELRQAGVLSVTGKGVVFSRRMTKDHARAGKGRKAVQKRWTQQAENKEKSAEPNRLGVTSPFTQKPEARGQIAASQPRATDLLDRLLEAAGIVGNPNPSLAFPGEILSLIEAGYDLETEVLPAIKARPNPRARTWAYFVPQIRDYAAKRRGIVAERAPEPPKADASTVKSLLKVENWTRDQWAQALEFCRMRGEWQDSFGPPPFADGCLVPPDMLLERDHEFSRKAA